MDPLSVLALCGLSAIAGFALAILLVWALATRDTAEAARATGKRTFAPQEDVL